MAAPERDHRHHVNEQAVRLAAEYHVNEQTVRLAYVLLRRTGILEGEERKQVAVAHPAAVSTLTDVNAEWPHPSETTDTTSTNRPCASPPSTTSTNRPCASPTYCFAGLESLRAR